MRVEDLPEYFRDKVVRQGDCLVWTKAKRQAGHGHLQRPGKQRKWVSAHQYSYELMVGEVPEGLILHHICCNPPCVNPDHLAPVTRQTNTRLHFQPLVTDDDVREIREWAEETCERLGIRRRQLASIISGYTRRDEE